MKKIYLLPALLLTLVTSSCVDDLIGTNIRYPTVWYFGDSLCTPVNGGQTAQQIVGIYSDCIFGRPLTITQDLPDPPQAELVFLGLGSNNVLLMEPLADFRSTLQTVLTRTTAKVYCVPPIPSYSLAAQPYKNIVLEECENILDPLDWGVDVTTTDGQHWDQASYNAFANGIQAILDAEGFTPTN